MSTTPTSTSATNTTTAPAELMSRRSGSPTSAPNQPPALSNAPNPPKNFSGPRTTCSRPSTAAATSAHPTSMRRGLSLRPRCTNAAPTPTSATGTT